MKESNKQTIGDQQLDQLLAKLPSQLAPQNDLWPEIQARIPSHSGPGWWRNTSLAASLLVGVLGLASALFSQLQNQELRQQLAGAEYQPAHTDTALATQTVSYQMAQSCAQAQQQIVIRENLAIIEAALAQIQNALKTAPNDPVLNRQFLDLSKQQINLLNRANTTAL
ncbi:hypothetical protein [Halioxenophilus sp. WMMB6]|uniref:hypothetical protein n=1 Tax=Halioxenophilus sp. WMMB6 TaxID=3073815 RepID=UPI00295EA2FF|nr:hypothetical protein [Halioxenophilus sp. WMMB6]